LPIADCRLPIADCNWLVNWQLTIGNWQLAITNHQSPGGRDAPVAQHIVLNIGFGNHFRRLKLA
jgi:hypothetical protein